MSKTSPTVFVSYSHRDELWKDRLGRYLGVLEEAGRITIWDDTTDETVYDTLMGGDDPGTPVGGGNIKVHTP